MLDLYRPILKATFKGIKYIYTLLDTATKQLDFQLLTLKREALEAFKTIKIVAKNLSSKIIEILRMDQGKEFINTAFNTYLTEYGILYKYLAPYTHKQNRAAERVNQTTLEKARCLLF